MSQPSTVLVAGSTGMFGRKIVQALLRKKKEVIPRILVREESLNDPVKNKFVEESKLAGAEVVYGDLMNRKSLLLACQGVDIVISAVGNSREQIIDAQNNLLDVAEQLGVKRFIPSDYSVDYFNCDLGDNVNLDLRKEFAGILMKRKVPYTFVMNGIFMEVLFTRWGTVFNFEDGIFGYWGDGETAIDITLTDDAASFVVNAALDPDMHNQKLRVAGDVQTYKDIYQLFNMITGQNIKPKSLGSIQELEQHIINLKGEATSPEHYLPLQYHYVMVTGKGKLDPLDNDRYPEIMPVSLKEYIQKMGYERLKGGDVFQEEFRRAA
jgi:uncharacterized protein YbjT (DUF2867 family)